MAFHTQSLVANTGYNRFSVRNNSATDGYTIYRQYDGGEVEKLGVIGVEPLETSIFDDYNAIHGRVANYWVTVPVTGGAIETTEIHTASQSFGGAYLHKVVKGVINTTTSNLEGALMHLVNQEGSNRELSVAANIIDLPAYDKPIIEVGTSKKSVWRIPLVIIDLSTTARGILNTWIQTHAVLCCRDDRGRRMFGVLKGVKEGLGLSGNYPFELHECDYREAITW
jgi:hypothetical protein